MTEEEQAKSALAWMRQQAREIDPSTPENEHVGHCARIISECIKLPPSPGDKIYKDILRLVPEKELDMLKQHMLCERYLYELVRTITHGKTMTIKFSKCNLVISKLTQIDQLLETLATL